MTTYTEERQDAPLRNLSAEAALLGSLIVHAEALDQVTEYIGPNDFSNWKNSTIYSAVCMSAIEGTSGLAAVVEQLRKDNALSDISEGYLHTLTKEACDPKELRQNVAILVDLARKREKISAANQIAASVIKGEDESFAFDKLMDVQNREVTIGDGFADLEVTMKSIITGTYNKTVPTILRRTDGQYLLYAGKLNWMSAPPEALKSFTALLASVQLMQEGKGVVYVDFEDDATTICERLYKVAVGQQIDNAEEQVLTWVSGPLFADGSRDKSKALFSYIAAGRAFDMKMRGLVLKAIRKGAQLVVIDGCATAIALAGLNENDNGEVNKWISAVSYPLTNAGAAVVVIDHVVKNAVAGTGSFANRSPRGAGSKLAAVSGASLSFEVKEAASVYSEGKIEITVTKDRPGRIMVNKRSGRRVAGILMAKPVLEGREGLSLTVIPVEEMDELSKQRRYDLIAAEKISELLSAGPLSKMEIQAELKERAANTGRPGLRTATVTQGYEWLIENGYASKEVGQDGKTQTLTQLMHYKAEYGDKHADDVDVSPF